MIQKRTEPYMSTYLHFIGRKKGVPIAGSFELTGRCNFSCPMCYVHRKNLDYITKELSTEEWISLAESAKNQGMVFALLTGGEPFIRKDFFEIYEAMKNMGLLVSVNSNGSLLYGKTLERLLESPPCRINISLYGASDETYANMCGTTAYKKILESILMLKNNGVDVCINLSITPYNHQDIKKIHDIAKEHELPIKASSYMYPPARLDLDGVSEMNRFSSHESAKYSVEWDLLRFSSSEFSSRVEAMKNYTVIEENECLEKLDDSISCRAGSSSFWISWDGAMHPCGMMQYPTVYPLEIGFPKAWEKLKRETENIHQPPKCLSCEKRKICGVCAAVCVTETGAFDKIPRYMCERTSEIIRLTLESEK